MRRRRPDEGVDVVAGRLAIHRRKSLDDRYCRASAPSEPGLECRRPDAPRDRPPVGAQLTVTRYVLTHGFQPLAYATIRYGAATLLFWGFTLRARAVASGSRSATCGSCCSRRSSSSSTSSASSTRSTRRSAATVTLFLGTTPIFIGVIASAIGLERMGRGFWAAALVSFVGVGFVASGSGGVLGPARRRRARDHDRRDLGGLLRADHAADAPLLAVSDQLARARSSAGSRSRSPAPRQTANQGFHFGWLMWVCFAFAVVGPLFLTNILWFTAISRVGPVARVALLEPAAVLRRALRARAARRAPDALGGRRRRRHPHRRDRRALTAPAARAARRLGA